MKKHTFIIAFLLTCASFSLQAQENDAFRTDTIEFLRLTGTGTVFENLIAQMGAGVPQNNKVAYLAEANGTLDGLYAQIADLYMAEFTHGEVKELIVFYQSPLGKKIASKQMQLMQQAMPLGQQWGAQLQQIVQKHGN